MGSSVFKFTRARAVALALGIGIAGSLATAPASFALAPAPPTPAGANCQADGKINGAGSTFQTNAINNAFTFGFSQDLCGSQPVASNLFQGISGYASWGTTDPSQFSFTANGTTNYVQGMVAYNYSLGGTAATNGSGAGLKRLSCRTDMFAGTDLPYTSTNLSDINSTPGKESGDTLSSPYHCDDSTLNTTAVPPPYGPQSYGAWPDSEDVSAKAMSFPIAAGAVAFVANLKGMCTTTPVGQTLNLTTAEIDAIFQGTINQWDDAVLDATDPWLHTDGCTGAIQRVVREDNSGTTSITMYTLNGYDKNTLCALGTAGLPTGPSAADNWYSAATSTASGGNWGYWPRGCVDTNNSSQSGSPLNTTAPNEIWAGETNTNTESGTSGSGALISTVEATNGGFGYAELGLWPNPVPDPTVSGNPDLVYAALPTPATQTSSTPTYILPGTPGAASNCKVPSSVPTGSDAKSAVGLGTVSWTDTGLPTAPGKQDIADPAGGAGYPACGLTFDMVYTGQSEGDELAAPASSAIAPTPGCTITSGMPSPVTTAVNNPVGSTILIAPTTGFPASGYISVAGQTLYYNGLSTTTGSVGFELADTNNPNVTTSNDPSDGSLDTAVPSGSSVSLLATDAAKTNSTPGLTGACLTYDDSLSDITNDQLRTLYSYFTYMFSPIGQYISSFGARNPNLGYQTLDPLPAAWLPNLEQGFQQNF